MKRIALLISFFIVFSSTIFSSIPVGYYYLAKGKKKAELKTALHNITSQAKMLSYGGGDVNTTWFGFYSTDRNSADNSVIDMYSNEIRYFNGYSGVNEMHIEHSLPKSWWGSITNNAYKDLHHLFPADGKTNSTKNNLPLGETSAPTFDNGVSKVGKNSFGLEYVGGCFEPADEYKGDFARAYFYVSTAYENLSELWDSPMMNKNTYPVWNSWAANLLLKWHRQDPVSAKERNRMETVYSIQGNRNPFIDYPDLVEYIWGNDTTKTYLFPEETEPFLVTPNRWTSLDFGVILKNDNPQKGLMLLGVNLTSDLNLSFLKGSTGFSLAVNSVPKNSALAGITLQLSFDATQVGKFVDTLQIVGGGLSTALRIPLRAVVSSKFVALEASEISASKATLNWIKNPDAESYLVDVYVGDTKAGDLFFSGYMEGSAWNKAIEIYNGTGQPVDLSNYTIRKQNNGLGEFESDFALSGNLANGATYLIVHGSASADLKAKAQLITGTDFQDILSFNGNDAMALFRDGIQIDVIGVPNLTTMWGENITFRRKQEVTHPTTLFNMSEWQSFLLDDWSVFGNYASVFDSESVYLLQNYPVGNVSSFQITNLTPNKKYTYRVYSKNTISTELCKNTVQFRTSSLEPPLVLNATNITATTFQANWEANTDAQSYLLNVFRLSGTGSVSDKTGFDELTSGGTPLPLGFTGKLSGSYTSTTSSGEAIPSAKLGNTDWLQTKTYTSPITNFSFMAKFASSSPDSYLKVESFNGSVWSKVDSLAYSNTSKFYPQYSFEPSKNISALRLTYTKVGTGFLALDDIQVSFGSYDTVYLQKNYSVTAEIFVVDNLLPLTEYFYSVRSVCGGFVSGFSDVISLVTAENGVSLPVIEAEFPKIYAPIPNHILVQAEYGTLVRIYDVFGRLLVMTKTERKDQLFRVPSSGVYIVSVNGKAQKLMVR